MTASARRAVARAVTATPRRAARSGDRVDLVLEGKRLAVSNLEKVLYPAAGFTKGRVIDYYARISPVLLPHLRDRPLTLKRYPDGVEGDFFYEKRCPPYRPSWVQTAPLWSDRKKAAIHLCVAADLPSLIWAANLADLELHTYLARIADVECPTMIMFDLDPGAPANILQCAAVGLLLRERLEQLGFQCFAKTSGSKGLQVCVPLNTQTSYAATKSFARGLANRLAREQPARIVSRMEKALRPGKVFIDWSQNDRHKTTVCVYSLRAKEHPTVSTPVTWLEVEQALKKQDASALSFLSDQVLARVEKRGDLFKPVLELRQTLAGS